MSYVKAELLNPDDEIWQRVMALTMSQTLNQMVFRSLVLEDTMIKEERAILGSNPSTAGTATANHIEWSDETVEMPQLGFCPATPTPASELTIEGKARVID